MSCNNWKNSITDYGPKPFSTNIDRMALMNKNYRAALWTGCHLQVTLMCIPTGGEIGLEIHEDTDQFIKIVDGNAMAFIGQSKNCLNLQNKICKGSGVFVPAGT